MKNFGDFQPIFLPIGANIITLTEFNINKANAADIKGQFKDYDSYDKIKPGSKYSRVVLMVKLFECISV